MLPGIGFSELLLIGLAALIIIGPKDLPMMMRKLGQIMGKGRRMAREFQAAFDDIARQSELDELKREIQELRKSNTLASAQDDLAAYEADVNSAIMREHPAAAPPETLPDAKPDDVPETAPAKKGGAA
ncbi:MAG: twin arginine-targeting protein translocase TatB [Hyphomonas sp. 34-62-18]|nr:Sec-independent protein translocase protein TatB [Hyphomonas sp. 34-62-18]OZB18013.1 MAG: twin arginine-targeting protein translocase TatB [Hyphomonas sp. 34-62-18]